MGGRGERVAAEVRMRSACFFLVIGTVTAAGCGDDDGVAATDAGFVGADCSCHDGTVLLPDAGPATDGGGDLDSGALDGGEASDAGAPFDAGPDYDAGPACSEMSMGSCPAGLTCIGCPSGPIMEHYLCTTSCTSGADCTDPDRPVCNLPGTLGGGGPGLCTPMGYGCTWGAMCAAPDTPIATPNGERPIASLREGDLVYSANHGALVPVPLRRVASTRVALGHHVMRVRLASGRTVEMSPGHPTADGRLFGELRAGAALDGVAIESSELVAYGFDRTYDILPASDTHTYVAAGVLVGSTLSP